MTVEDVADRHYREQATLAARAAAQSHRAWSLVDAADPVGSWQAQRLEEAVYVGVSRLQWQAASAADGYVDAALGELGLDGTAAGRLRSRTLAGVASDGRSLETLLRGPAIMAGLAIRRGVTPARALTAFGRRLDRISATQVQDAGRVAVGVAIAARPNVTGYVRMLAPPSCGRCAVLAGRFYRWSSGFQRHPLCDCQHIPAAEDVAGDLRTDPRRYFDSLGEDEQDDLFGPSTARAIRDGADVGRAVNATGRPGRVYTAGGRKLTGELAGGQLRPTPEQIYADAPGRGDAIRLLQRHGYIT